MAGVYANYLHMFVSSPDPNLHLLRTFLDEWFAYSVGGPFWNRNGRPRWFDNPKPAQTNEALLKMNFVSDAASRVIHGEIGSRLVKDHSVPISVLAQTARRSELNSVEGTVAFFQRYYRVGVLTMDEDLRLSALKLGRSMPVDWDGKDPFARYREAGIQGIKQRGPTE